MTWGESPLVGLVSAIMRFDIETFIKKHGAMQLQNLEWSLVCTGCGKDKLIVNTSKRTWHCWVCQRYETVYGPTGPVRKAVAGAGGLVDLVQMLEVVSKATAARMVINAGLLSPEELSNIPDWILEERSYADMDVTSVEIDLPDFWTKFGVDHGGVHQMSVLQAHNFLNKRRITADDVDRFRLGWCWGGQYANRLVFPTYEDGKLVYFQARAMWDPRPGERYVKALNPRRVEGSAVSSDLLFNLDTARHAPRVAITEGPIDCIHTGWDAVATFGKELHPLQVGKLLQAGVKALDLMWDADAYSNAVATANRLSSLFDVRIVRLPYGDPGDFTRPELTWHRAHGVALGGIQVIQ